MRSLSTIQPRKISKAVTPAEFAGRHAEMTAKHSGELAAIGEIGELGDVFDFHAPVVHQVGRVVKPQADHQLFRRDVAVLAEFTMQVTTVHVEVRGDFAYRHVLEEAVRDEIESILNSSGQIVWIDPKDPKVR